MKRFAWLILILAFLSSPTWASDDTDEDIEVAEEEDVVIDEEPEADALGEEEDDDVTVKAHWPNERVVIGEETTVLVSFSNNGQAPINITHIGAHLHSPFDYSFFVQNFSVRGVGAVVEGGQEVSLEYLFRPDKSLEPAEYWLSGWLVYNDSLHRQYLKAYHNATIELSEAASSSLIDLQQVFLMVTMAGLSGLVVYSVMNYLNQGKKKRGGRPAATAATDNTNGESKVDSSWDPPAIYKASAKSVAANRRTGKNKSAKGSEKHSAKDSTKDSTKDKAE